jgi:hypothetical protein
MAMNDSDALIRELERDVEEEKQSESFRKQLPWLIGGAVALVVGVAAWQIYQANKAGDAARGAEVFQAAEKVAAQNPMAGMTEFTQIANTGSDGYSALAAVRVAMTYAEIGDREKAIGLYLQAAEKPGVPERFVKFSRLKAAQLALEDGRDRVVQILGGLDEEPTALGAGAREVMGIAAMEAGDYGAASNIFTSLQSDPDALIGVQQRAREFAVLAKLGSSGIAVDFDRTGNDGLLLDIFDAAPEGDAGENGEPMGDVTPETPAGAPVDAPVAENGTSGN